MRINTFSGPADMKALPSRYVAWVTAAFGPFWGFQEGWWSWLSGVTDNSVYPVLFLTYLDAVVPGAGLLPDAIVSCDGLSGSYTWSASDCL